MTKYELKKLWEQEIKRVQRLVNKAKKQGVEFEFEPIPKEPKRITEKSVQRIKKIDIEFIKRKGKKEEQQVRKPRKKSEKIDTKSAIKPLAQIDVKTKKPRNPPVLTEEQLKERARKAAQTRKQREQQNPELAEKRRLQRAENLRKTREKMKERERTDSKYAEEQAKIRSERARKAAQTRKQREQENPELAEKRRLQRAENLRKAREKIKQKEEHDKLYEKKVEKEIDLPDGEYEVKDGVIKKKEELTPQPQELTEETTETEEYEEIEETPLGIDALTGEIVTEETKKDKRDYGETEIPKTLDEPLDEKENIIETLKGLFERAINQNVADILSEALEDAISSHEVDGDVTEWLQQLNQADSELIERAYVIKEDSDGERIRSNAMSLLIIIYGSYSNIPSSVLEEIEFATSEYFYPTKRWAKQSAHRLRKKAYQQNK